jgi:hypothetical protein
MMGRDEDYLTTRSEEKKQHVGPLQASKATLSSRFEAIN